MMGASSANVVPAAITRVLGRTPRAQWPSLAVVADAETETVRLLTRGELASELRAGDLPDLANEATARRVPPGALLILYLGEHAPRFCVVGDERRAPGTPRGRTRP